MEHLGPWLVRLLTDVLRDLGKSYPLSGPQFPHQILEW